MTGTSIKLNADGVIKPLLNKMHTCQHIILFGLRSLAQIDHFPEEVDEEKEAFNLQIGELPSDLDSHKSNYKLWLLKKGFEDLAQGLKLALMEAYYYVSIIEKKDDLKTYGKFKAEVEKLKKTAIEQSLPGITNKVKPLLTNNLNYIDEIESINLARNCLVHADGFITDRHINDKENERLIVKGLRWKLFYEDNGHEIEVGAGSVVPAGKAVKMTQENFELYFNKGQRIDITYKDFNNFIKTCFQFGEDLKSKLPALKN